MIEDKPFAADVWSEEEALQISGDQISGDGPLTGQDLATIADHFSVSMEELQHIIGMSSTGVMNLMRARGEGKPDELPLEVAILLRYLLEHRDELPMQRRSPDINAVYEDFCSVDPDFNPRRLGLLFGRAAIAGYRWVNGDNVNYRGTMARLLMVMQARLEAIDKRADIRESIRDLVESAVTGDEKKATAVMAGARRLRNLLDDPLPRGVTPLTEESVDRQALKRDVLDEFTDIMEDERHRRGTDIEMMRETYQLMSFEEAAAARAKSRKIKRNGRRKKKG